MWEAYGNRLARALSTAAFLLTGLSIAVAVYGRVLAKHAVRVAVGTGVVLVWLYVVLAVRVGKIRSRLTPRRRRV